MALYREYLNNDEKQQIKDIDAARERMKARSAEYAAKKKAIIHRATERRRTAEKSGA